MNNLKQAQVNYDNQLPPDTSERDEMIKDYAEMLVDYGVVENPTDHTNFVYLDDLEIWMKDAEYKYTLEQSKIHKYKQLQLELCEYMLLDNLNKGE